MQKLDSFNKILLATGTINYLASSINGLNEQIKMLKDGDGAFKKGIEHRDAALAEAVEDLKKVMNKLGDLINAQDAICSLDHYVTLPAFNVVVHGHDEVDGDFNNLQG
jgi:predicted KAP-like P-loop ATPase